MKTPLSHSTEEVLLCNANAESQYVSNYTERRNVCMYVCVVFVCGWVGLDLSGFMSSTEHCPLIDKVALIWLLSDTTSDQEVGLKFRKLNKEVKLSGRSKRGSLNEFKKWLREKGKTL